MHDATLVLVVLIVEGARFEAVRVLSVQKLRDEQGLVHLVGIIRGLVNRLRLLLVLEGVLLLVALEAVAELARGVRAVKLLLREEKLLGLKIK